MKPGHPPPMTSDGTRLVCISDTHNQHEELRLPGGHVLVHAGDLLTESGTRHVRNGRATDQGVALVERFARWFGEQPHAHKILVPGNHDMVLQALGEEAVTAIFHRHCRPGSFAYLLDRTASLPGSVKAYGSPFAPWSGHNNAFAGESDYRAMEAGTHVMITHFPAMLPPMPSTPTETGSIVRAMRQGGALVHIGGHCHWARGEYLSSAGVPCLVASICGSGWKAPRELAGARGDREGDQQRGGYNVVFPPVVVDVSVPAPDPRARWALHPRIT